MDISTAVDEVNQRRNSYELGIALRDAIRETLDPLRELHRGWSPEEKAQWLNALRAFISATNDAGVLPALRARAEQLSASSVDFGLEAAAGALLLAAIAGDLESGDALEKLSYKDAGEVRIRVYRAAVATTNNLMPQHCAGIHPAPPERAPDPPPQVTNQTPVYRKSGDYFRYLFENKGMKDAEIRDHWQRMSNDERMKICPDDWCEMTTSIKVEDKPSLTALAEIVKQRRKSSNSASAVKKIKSHP